MDVKFLNPFIDAAVEVMKAEVGIDVARGDLTVQKTAMTTDDVTVLIHLVGQVYGVVLYGMPILTGLNVVSQIMGQKFTEFNSLAQSGVAELGNVITGRSTIKFSEAGFSSNISTPTIITGKGVQISTLDFPRIIVPLRSQLGDIMVHLALKETQPGHEENPEDFVKLTIAQSAPHG